MPKSSRESTKPLDPKTKLIILLITIIVILTIILGSRATLQSNIPIDSMQDPLPFRQSCELKAPETSSSKPANNES